MATRQKPASHPMLLVSVRNDSEARAALAGGCDILDVKEPGGGSLGFAGVGAIRNVIHSADESGRPGTSVPVSAALGEVLDWQDSTDLGVPSDVVQLPRGLTYVKLGLAGLGGHSDWESRWVRVRHRFDKRAEQPLCWVAVAYADWQDAGSPRPEEVIDAAQGVCGVFLVDTHTKDGRSLLDWMSGDDYLQIARRTRRLGMSFAVAGSLRSDHLPALGAAAPDIVAIRTAACRGGVRNNRVSANAVRAFKAALESCFDASDFARASQVL